MGRGRTTTGMVTACLIATTLLGNHDLESIALVPGMVEEENDNGLAQYDLIDGPSEEEAYLQGLSVVALWYKVD